AVADKVRKEVVYGTVYVTGIFWNFENRWDSYVNTCHTLNSWLSFEPNAASEARAIQPNIYLSISMQDTQPIKAQHLLNQMKSCFLNFDFHVKELQNLLSQLSL
ncbi:hypothetical protein VP01_11024g1, partial [Puccinia sorghi]